MPVKAEWRLDQCVGLTADLQVRVRVASEVADCARWFADHARAAFGVSWRVEATVSDMPRALPVEGYTLKLSPADGIDITAKNLTGVRYAFQTLRQLAQPKRGTMKVEGWIAPACEIEDAPKMAFRGMHLCWFPEVDVKLIERRLRLAGYYKMNHVVLENWGTFRSERHPWWGWADGSMTKGEIRRLKAIADDLGITLVPQFNVFGHAAMSRIVSGKHAVLDLQPEYQPLFEPHLGWNWCLSNPYACQTIDELVVEMHEAFGNPPYFHIGCDEADPPSCAECRAQDYVGLVASNITRVAKLLETRGARAMMWHDMLLKKGEWGMFYAKAEHGEEKMLGVVPKSIVICDWYYEGVVSTNGYPTFAHFRKAGYDLVTAPWECADATVAQADAARQVGALGLLGTTWHRLYKQDIGCQFVSSAAAAWGTRPEPYAFPDHWRQMGWDMHVDNYGDCGLVEEQVPSKPHAEISPL